LDFHGEFSKEEGVDMELRLPKSITKFYWFLFPVILVITGYNNIFNNWELPLFGFSEFEDIGRLLFVLGVSACESALATVFLWLVIKTVKRISSKPTM
jgi:hypothetical protein